MWAIDGGKETDMIVHISLFYLKDKSDADKVAAALRRVPEQEKHIRTSFVGRNWFARPVCRTLPMWRRSSPSTTGRTRKLTRTARHTSHCEKRQIH